jgi:hypothetical protein
MHAYAKISFVKHKNIKITIFQYLKGQRILQ